MRILPSAVIAALLAAAVGTFVWREYAPPASVARLAVQADTMEAQRAAASRKAVPLRIRTDVRCSATQPRACRDTGDFRSSGGFFESVKRFVGNRQLSDNPRDKIDAREVADALDGPPDTPYQIGPFYRFTACWPHQCMVKGAGIVTPEGQIVAVAHLAQACKAASNAQSCKALGFPDTCLKGCEDRYILSLLVHDRHALPIYLDDLIDWARHAVDGQVIYKGDDPQLREVRIADLDGHVTTLTLPPVRPY